MKRVSSRASGEEERLRRALAATEERLETIRSDLEATRRQVSEVRTSTERALAMMVHELRGPLMPMLVMTHLLEADSSLSAQQQRAVAAIRRNIEAEDRLVSDLGDLSRIAGGKVELSLAETELGHELRDVLIGCDREIRDKRLRVVMQLLAKNQRVMADPVRLRQIVWNLLHNAVKFTPAGGRITIRSDNTRSGQLQLEVSDTGIGIARELLPRIFEPFEQGGSDVTREFGGLGLGLAVSKGLIEAHGGTLSARSDGPGKGATFTLELPVAAR